MSSPVWPFSLLAMSTCLNCCSSQSLRPLQLPAQAAFMLLVWPERALACAKCALKLDLLFGALAAVLGVIGFFFLAHLALIGSL